jgi:hypothetical protein
MMVGALCALLGVWVLLGALRSGDPNGLYVDSMGQSSAYERTKRVVLEAYASYRFMVLMSLAGLIAALVGIVITRAVVSSLL